MVVHFSNLIPISLAIFSILFGAGNLILPIKIGIESGTKTPWALVGFLTTGILMPLLGIVGVILFKGDYYSFFKRLGHPVDHLLMLLCMLILGPLRGLPMVITTTYCTVGPYMSNPTLLVFAVFFLLLIFLGSYKEQQIITILGNVISPILLCLLGIIIVKGTLIKTGALDTPDQNNFHVFYQALTTGYRTLDLLGAIFFTSMLMSSLKRNIAPKDKKSIMVLASRGFFAGCLALSLLALIYIGLTYIGAYHGKGLIACNATDLLHHIGERILTVHGRIIFAATVFFACYSTCIALASITATYMCQLTGNLITYVPALMCMLVTTFLLLWYGIDHTLPFTRAVIELIYPVLIMLTLCNILYRTVGFKPVKVPCALTFIISCYLYWWPL